MRIGMRGMGAIAKFGAQRKAMLSASVFLASCFLLLVWADPVKARQDCPHSAVSQISEDEESCGACKRALRPNRTLLSRSDDMETAGAPLPAIKTLAKSIVLAAPWPGGGNEAHVRTTGLMRLGNVVLLN